MRLPVYMDDDETTITELSTADPDPQPKKRQNPPLQAGLLGLCLPPSPQSPCAESGG
jgi:hypothetical protein